MGYSLDNRGGPREGAGRPKLNTSEKKEPTVVMRVPKSLKKTVEKLIAAHEKD